MELKELVEIQHTFDQAHGWSSEGSPTEARLRFVSHDIVGLVGEIGEFASAFKRIGLDVDRSQKSVDERLALQLPNLQEELADSFIYMMRIAKHLDIDIESAYLTKLEINRVRYRELELSEDGQ